MGDGSTSVVLSDNAPFRLFSSVMRMQWQAALVPLSLTQYWLSAFATLVLRVFVVLGAPPKEYRNNVKVRLLRLWLCFRRP